MSLFAELEEPRPYPRRQFHHLDLSINHQGLSSSVSCLHDPVPDEFTCLGDVLNDEGFIEYANWYDPEDTDGEEIEEPVRSGTIVVFVVGEDVAWRYAREGEYKP